MILTILLILDLEKITRLADICSNPGRMRPHVFQTTSANIRQRPVLHTPHISTSIWISNTALWTTVIVLAVVWFATIGTRALISPDEGRYVSLLLEMLHSGDWITPRLNDLLYFEKPPLQYWIGALFFKLLGVNEFAARLWPALAGFLTLLLVGFTGARLWDRETGIRASAIAASMVWVIGNSHFLTLDAGLTLFMTLSLSAVLLGQFATSSRSQRRKWVWIAWASMAGAVLSKDLIGILIPGAMLLMSSLWRRDFTLWRGMHWLSGLLIFFLLAAPWFVLVSMRNPGFAEFFFIHEHFARYLTTVHHREGVWWYYIPLLLVGLLPWSGGLPWLFRTGDAATAARSICIHELLITWVVFILVFFSVSDSKLPSYILPAFPALALMFSVQLGRTSTAALRWHLLVPALVGMLMLAASIQVERFVSPQTHAEVLAHFTLAIQRGAALLLAGTSLAWWHLKRDRLTSAVLSLALGALLAGTTLMQAHDAFGQSSRARSS